MRQFPVVVLFILLLVLSACSSGGGNPTAPSDGLQPQTLDSGQPLVLADASDVLFVNGSRETAYKAFGIFQVVIDLRTLTAEITPVRKAHGIGMTFDSDLTQFLTVSPCTDCLQVNGIRLLSANQVEVGFAVKHPFADITKRPDLHAFDVRGIVLTVANYDFPLTQVATGASSTVAAKANVSLIANADGYTHHFDGLASDPNYYIPPWDYNANINPYKRYFVNGGTPQFNPNNPLGHNVMAVGADWETQKYIFDISGSSLPIMRFGFIMDCAYGQSATFQNRKNPLYFLPEFNRKEAWKVDISEGGGRLESGNTSSSINYRVSVCDWQAGLNPDPAYPNPSSLGGIKAKSDVKSVSIEIPGVTTNLIEKNTPNSGEGTEWNPYVFNITVTNSSAANAGWYYGIVAVRDDLQGQQGPIAIPPSPAGFPYPGPEIYDYSTYQIFKVRVFGKPPSVSSYSYNISPYEGEYVDFNININEPDGDRVTYHWEQAFPPSPMGYFQDANVKNASWLAPPVNDVPPSGVAFELKLTMKDDDGEVQTTFPVQVMERNSAPICLGIVTDPYFGVIRKYDVMTLQAYGQDPDGDTMLYDWDLDWDGVPANFNVDQSGNYVFNYSWPDQGFYKVGCRIKEERNYPKETYCSRDIVQEGVTNADIKVDNSDVNNAGFDKHDVCMVRDSLGRPVYHVAWVTSNGNGGVFYANNALNPKAFGNHQQLSLGPSTGRTTPAKVTGLGQNIHVAWIEKDTSDVPTVYRLKIRSSDNGGYSFDAMGGERVIVAASEPNKLVDFDISVGSTANKIAVVFSDESGGNYRCTYISSNDGGLSWSFPSSGGFFRDILDHKYAGDFTIKLSRQNYIHVVWQDYRNGTSNYYYDISLDNGETWGTDLKVNQSFSMDPSFCSMAIDENNSAYFAWIDSNGMAYFNRTYYSTPPTIYGENSFFNAGVGLLNSISIYITPDGKTLLIPVIFHYIDHYETRYFYSFDRGYNINRYFEKLFPASVTVGDIVCDGRYELDPNRIELFSAWIDTRTTPTPMTFHVRGEFFYIVERF